MKYQYDKMNKVIDKIIEKNGCDSHLHFCLYETLNDEDSDFDPCKNWLVEAPNFNSKIPVYKGKCVFYSAGSFNKHQSRVISNPTWKDILIEANNAARGDHIFLESIELEKTIKGIKYYKFSFGS